MTIMVGVIFSELFLGLLPIQLRVTILNNDDSLLFFRSTTLCLLES